MHASHAVVVADAIKGRGRREPGTPCGCTSRSALLLLSSLSQATSLVAPIAMHNAVDGSAEAHPRAWRNVDVSLLDGRPRACDGFSPSCQMPS